MSKVYVGRRTRRCVPGIKNEIVAGSDHSVPKFLPPFVIDTDASETALGAVLSQVIDEEARPIAFESRVLSKRGVNYATTKQNVKS